LILTTIWMEAEIERRKELLLTLSSLYGPIINERGCLGCHFYSEIGNESVVLMVEEWESEGHWKDHLQSKEFSVLLGAMILVSDPKEVHFKLLAEVTGVGSLKRMRTERNDKLLES
jgi:quinol monooxygenase YgiN